MKISVDYLLCDANGNCCKAAPRYFRLDDDEVLNVLQVDVDAADAEDVRAAVVVCPKNAISLTE